MSEVIGVNQNALVAVPFHGDEIVSFQTDGVRAVAMRRMVENLGLSWGSASQKLQRQRGKFSCFDIETTGADGKRYLMLAMPVEKLPLWLATINPNKVRADLRPKIELYQSESAIALHDYWTKGVAVRGDLDGVVTDLDPRVRSMIGGIIGAVVRRELNERMPKVRDELVTALIETDPRVAAVIFKPALDVLVEQGVPPRRRRAFSQKVSGRLGRFSEDRGFHVRRSRETGRRLFHVDAIQSWLEAEGKALIRDHLAATSGQGLLKLVPRS
jgi:hypothetical protein